MLDRNDMMIPFERQTPQGGQQAMMPYMPAPMAPYMPPPEPEEPSLIAGIFRHLWIVVVMLGICLIGACFFLKNTTPQFIVAPSGLLDHRQQRPPLKVRRATRASQLTWARSVT